MKNLMTKMRKLLKYRPFIAWVGMIAGTVVYCFSVVFILDMGKFYAGGITGISQIFANAFNMPYLKSILVAVLNVPLFIFGWKQVSKRFAVLSLFSVILQVVIIALFDLLKEHGFNPFLSMAQTNENGELINILVFALLGGFLTGAGCGLTLRAGSSTGGMDIISQCFSLKFGISFTVISGILDTAIIVCGAIVGGSISTAVYTLIRLITHIITLDKIHTIYKYQQISFVTKMKDEVKVALFEHFNHSMTIFEVLGGYTNEQKWLIEAVVLTYEVEDYNRIIHSIDPHAFITYSSIKGVIGKYNKNVIN